MSDRDPIGAVVLAMRVALVGLQLYAAWRASRRPPPSTDFHDRMDELSSPITVEDP